MNFKGDFLKLGNCDVSKLQETVSLILEELWYGDTFRQEQFPVHKNTQTIPLIFDADMRHDNPTVHPYYYEIKEIVDPLMNQVALFYNKQLKAQRLKKKYGRGYFVRVILVRLSPGCYIAPHTDNGFSLSRVHRVHIPIITSDNTSFSVGEMSKSLAAGEIWEINNRHMHAVNNSSENSRVHLILDYVLPGEKILDVDGEVLISLPV